MLPTRPAVLTHVYLSCPVLQVPLVAAGVCVVPPACPAAGVPPDCPAAAG
jgi:hypothetical protein